jgi:hypothetical protein
MNLSRSPSDRPPSRKSNISGGFGKDARESLPSWIESVEKPSIDDVPIEVRMEGEKFLVQETMKLVQKIKDSVVEDIAGGNRKEVLTWHEQDVFSRFTYYGFKYGIPAGIATFAVLYGGLRYAAYRKFLREMNLPNTPDYHARLAARRNQYLSLDRPQNLNRSNIISSKLDTNLASETAALPTVNTTNSNSFTFAIFPDDVYVTVQFYVTAAIGIFVSVMTWHQMFDWPRLHKDVSKLPLQAGPSLLCHALCKNLIKHRNNILHNEISIPSISVKVKEVPSSSTGSDSTTTTQQALKLIQLRGQDLWEDPMSEDLELMVQMVHNCEQRMRYEKECRQRDVRMVQPVKRLPVWVVDVPEPGVPIRYHKVSNKDT